MFMMLLILAPVASGLLGVLSLPSFDLGFLAWFCLAPLLFVLRQRGPLAAAGLGFLFGYVFGAGSFYWLNALPFLTPLRFHLLVVGFSLYYLLFGLLYNLVSRAVGVWVIVAGPAVWVALEYARGNISFLSLAWNFLGHSQYQYLPIIQVADLTGVYGISFLLVMANQLLSELPDFLAGRGLMPGSDAGTFRPKWAVHLFIVSGLLASALLYGSHKVAEPESGQRLRVALVQANLVAHNGVSIREQMEHLRAYRQLTKEAAREEPQLIVWPSSSLPAPLGFWMVRFYVDELASEVGTHLLVGGAGGDKLAPPKGGSLPFSNSQFLISPSRRLEGEYSKIHLTPFTEYLPLYGKIKWPRSITSLEHGYIPGQTYTLFEVAHARFGAPICWESTFPDIFRRFVFDGAQFMVNVTNEGVFGATSAPHQTLAMNVFRAVENRVTIARSATTGVSAFINSKGQIIGRISDADGKDLFVSGVLVRDVPLANKRTFYTLHGDIFAQAAIGVVSLVLVVCMVTQRRRREQPSGDLQPEPSMTAAP